MPQATIRSGDKECVICLLKSKEKTEIHLERFHFENLKRNLDTIVRLLSQPEDMEIFIKSNYKKNKIIKESNVGLLFDRLRIFERRMGRIDFKGFRRRKEECRIRKISEIHS